MKEIELSTACDFSEAGIETAMLEMRHFHHNDNFALILTVSVFDVNGAVRMMIDDRTYGAVRYVHVTPEFRDGEWSLVDELNDCYIKSGV